jgi:8-oxo-dGTP diphosphatase
MNHRISAGMIILDSADRVLMVRHRVEARYDFWVTPGGGVKGSETLEQAAEREVLEETGLRAKAEQLVYIEEFYNPETRHCKFWFLGKAVQGPIDVSAPEARDEFIVEAAWLTQSEINNRQVFPEFMPRRFWHDLAKGHKFPEYLGLREMHFW